MSGESLRDGAETAKKKGKEVGTRSIHNIQCLA